MDKSHQHAYFLRFLLNYSDKGYDTFFRHLKLTMEECFSWTNDPLCSNKKFFGYGKLPDGNIFGQMVAIGRNPECDIIRDMYNKWDSIRSCYNNLHWLHHRRRNLEICNCIKGLKEL